MIQKQHTPRLIWELKLPISSKIHSKAFITISDTLYSLVHELIHKNMINSINKKYET